MDMTLLRILLEDSLALSTHSINIEFRQVGDK